MPKIVIAIEKSLLEQLEAAQAAGGESADGITGIVVVLRLDLSDENQVLKDAPAEDTTVPGGHPEPVGGPADPPSWWVPIMIWILEDTLRDL